MSDLIERKDLGAAIDNWLAIDRYYHPYSKQKTIPVFELVDIIKLLPSAQPELIRCKDCKHSEHWYRDKRRCFLWHETGIDVFEDGYCNYAEMEDNE